LIYIFIITYWLLYYTVKYHNKIILLSFSPVLYYIHILLYSYMRSKFVYHIIRITVGHSLYMITILHRGTYRTPHFTKILKFNQSTNMPPWHHTNIHYKSFYWKTSNSFKSSLSLLVIGISLFIYTLYVYNIKYIYITLNCL